MAEEGRLLTIDVFLDRLLFLRALQNCSPAFWCDFQQSTLGTGGTCATTEGEKLSVEKWAESAGVVDDWFIRVLADTRAHWIENPDHGGSRLQTGYQWFFFPEAVAIPPFAPVFDKPYPLFNGRMPLDLVSTTNLDRQTRAEIARTQRIETPDEFAARMKGQFVQQIGEYKKVIRHLSLEGDNRGRRQDHAEWTALIFKGKTVSEISEKWPGLQQYDDPEGTVHKAVQRFAADIGLTLRERLKLDRKSV